MDELFDFRLNEGRRTYAGLIDYVRQKTGKGTSKLRKKLKGKARLVRMPDFVKAGTDFSL
jgi:hypothetical protein